MDNDWGDRFDYTGFWGCDSFCYVKVNGGCVICTEAPDNTGTSITNMAEQLATTICNAYGIPFHRLTWIEHYPNSPERGSEFPEDYSWVSFSIERDTRTGKLAFCCPEWRFITKEDAESIYGNG